MIGGRAHQYAHAPHPLRLLRARRERPRGCRAAEKRDELAPPIKKTRSRGTIAKRVGLAKRPKPAKGLPFSSSRVGRQRPVRNSLDHLVGAQQDRCWNLRTYHLRQPFKLPSSRYTTD